MAPGTNRHIDEEEIEKYLLSDASQEECARLEEHILVCEACRQRLAEEDVYLSSMRLASRYMRVETASKGTAAAWAAARLALVFGVVAVLASVTLFVGPSGRLRQTLAPVPVDLAASRGPLMVKAPAGRDLELRCDLTGLPGLPSYRLEVVDSFGRRVRQAEGRVPAQVAALPRGSYFVRVYSPEGDLLREYGLELGDS